MPTPEGKRLADAVKQKAGELNRFCEGISEETASRAPEGRWTPKQIISHLCGPEETGLLPAVRLFLDKDMPRLDIEAEDPFFTGKRTQMTFEELRREMDKEYSRIADLVSGLSEEELGRKAHIPLFRETPMGEYPTLAVFVSALGEHHIDFHIKHMQEILQALGAT